MRSSVVKLSGLKRVVSKMVTGCLSKTKVAKFVVEVIVVYWSEILSTSTIIMITGSMTIIL